MLTTHLGLAGLSFLSTSLAGLIPTEAKSGLQPRQDGLYFAWDLHLSGDQLERAGYDPVEARKLMMEDLSPVTCNQQEITSVNDYTPTERWQAVHATDVWANMSWWYFEENEAVNVNLQYAAWTADKLHATENMACQALKGDNGCSAYQQCDDTRHPAGFLILNSMVSLNNMLWNFYEAANLAAGDMHRDVSQLTDRFSPQAKNDGLSLAVILDIVALGYVSASAPFWNSLIKRSAWFRRGDQSNTHGTLKDLSKDLVTGGLTLAKDLTKASATALADREFVEIIQGMTEIWSKSAAEYNSLLFDGSGSSLRTLTDLFRDGKFVTVDVGKEDGGDTIEDLKDMVKRPMFAQLIPRAWRMSNRGLGAFILKSRTGCDQDVARISSEMKESNGVCIDDVLYVLAGAEATDEACTTQGDTGRSCFDDFQNPPGADYLNGDSDRFAGITVEDIVRAAVATWKHNGKENKVGETAVSEEDVSKWASDGNLVDDMIEQGIRVAGLINMPICSDIEATKNQEDAANSVGPGTGNFVFYPNYPCNE